jgi:hypothetical protein
MFHPKPEVAQLDTSLRYTDILFGFVIREIFLRLQYWQNLPRHVLMHLGVCTALVLGSWIGYRRSLNRSSYEIKFFNLPFFRFLLDQAMLILYFQMAGSTSVEIGRPTTDLPSKAVVAPDPTHLANGTIKVLLYIFILYWAWDALGIWMARTRASGQFRYPAVKDKKPVEEEQQTEDWEGLTITVVFLGLLGVLWLLLDANQALHITPNSAFIIATVLLVAYRLAKETKTSWRQA